MLAVKQRIKSLYSMTPEKISNRENAKRNIHRSYWKREIGKNLLKRFRSWGYMKKGRQKGRR